jgi:hypothetical protein
LRLAGGVQVLEDVGPGPGAGDCVGALGGAGRPPGRGRDASSGGTWSSFPSTRTASHAAPAALTGSGGAAGQPGPRAGRRSDELGLAQPAVGQHGMTFEVHGRECRLCVVVGHEI